MLKSKLSLIIYGILIMVIFASPKEGNAANISDKDFYDSYNIYWLRMQVERFKANLDLRISIV